MLMKINEYLNTARYTLVTISKQKYLNLLYNFKYISYFFPRKPFILYVALITLLSKMVKNRLTISYRAL